MSAFVSTTKQRGEMLDSIKRISANMASDIFESLGMSPGKSSDEEDSNALNIILDKLRNVDAIRLYKYLTGDDCAYIQRISQIVKDAMKDVFSDNTITLADVPKLTDMIRKIVSSLNESHSEPAPSTVSSQDALSFVKAVVTLVLQIVIPGEQYSIVIKIMDSAFELVSTQLVPLIQAKCSGSCGCPWFA